ncbi:MAG: hypothetical protein KJ600_05040 [Nanoarchaeota archaeon]|nr:hypothetical protein [Nanoarchaeota archaeon]MBU1103896.1 hypothetical protein [Nanoarchaeota archaeon]
MTLHQKELSAHYFSLLSLLTFNFIAVVGVLFWDWSSSFLLFSYWLENLAIGFFNVLKMSKATKMGNNGLFTYSVNGKDVRASKSGTIVFFIFHYGGFMFVHLIFLLFFIFGGFGGLERPDGLARFFGQSFIFFIGVFVSHLVSYKVNYVGNEEYKKASVGKLFVLPYKRIIPIHVTIILAALVSSPALLLIGLKTLIDVVGHLGERKKFRK